MNSHIVMNAFFSPENQAKNVSNNSKDSNRRQETSLNKMDDEEWDEPVSPKPVSSQKQSKPISESTPKTCQIATKKKSIPSPPPKKSLKTANMPLNTEVVV